MSFSCFLSLLAVLMLATDASAYIDPGTGGMIVSGIGGAIWPLIAAFFAAVTGIIIKFFKPIRNMIAGTVGRLRGR